MVSQLPCELVTMEERKQAIVIGTNNIVSMVDPSVVGTGPFEAHLYLGPSQEEDRLYLVYQPFYSSLISFARHYGRMVAPDRSICP